MACLAFPAMLLHFSAAGAEPDVQARYTTYVQGERELSRSNVGDGELTAGINALYASFSGEVMSGETYKSLPDADVLLLYQAASTSAFYSDDSTQIMDMAQLAAELDSRGVAKPAQIRQTYHALIGGRLFAQALQWRQRYPQLLEEVHLDVTDMEEAHSLPTELVFTGGSASPERRTAALPATAYIIAIGHPLCHFSQRAATELAARYRGQPDVLAAIKWMAPQQRESNFDIFQHWNASHPDSPMSIAYMKKEWPAIDSWATPTLYFFRQGTLQYKLTGWPKEGRMTEFSAGLRAIGLADEPALQAPPL